MNLKFSTDNIQKFKSNKDKSKNKLKPSKYVRSESPIGHNN